MSEKAKWLAKRSYTSEELALANAVLQDVEAGMEVNKALRRHPLPGGEGFLAKHALVAAYRAGIKAGEREPNDALLAKIRMKPVRTLSGVTTITVLTRPAPCPGNCLFCPTEEGMPQSYLPDEPGARRGAENEFDPYRQVESRLRALHEVGHPTDKIELLILGGSWSAYPADYRAWFIRRCFEALNGENPLDDQGDVDLAMVQERNVHGKHRNVGLVVETRPDLINREALLEFRKMGVTKLQLGIQSMDDEILQKNMRGHSAECAKQAIALARAAGFKLVAHWMPNLLGASPQSDRLDFARLWEEASIQPDELKIYPCQLLRNAGLYAYWQRGEYQPYSEAELLELLADIKTTVPRYCRINRVIRDIPSTNVISGNRNTSLRQDVARELKRRGEACQCLRCREVRGGKIDRRNLQLHSLEYETGIAQEVFLSFDSPLDKVAGFLRLSLPHANLIGLEELEDAAMIREVHVYGQSLELGSEKQGAAQHSGLGSRLIEEAVKVAKKAGYSRLAVISAIGTQAYYEQRNFRRKSYYMVREI